MPRRQRSPVRVGDCTPWPFPPRSGERRRAPICKWVCDADRLGVAEFVHRANRKLTAVLHPSTKRAGAFQVSRFDDGTPTGDIVGAGCTEVLKAADIRPATWRLRAVEMRRR